MKRSLIAMMVLTTFLAACGTTETVQVTDAWARASTSVQDAGAVYMTLNGGAEADQLLSVSVNGAVASAAEMHENATVANDDGAEMMMMQPLENIAVSAGGVVTLKPGGNHIMLVEPVEPLEAGSQFTVTLEFEDAGTVDVLVEVREE